MSTPKKIAINCSNCRSQVVLPFGYKFPTIRCHKCYSSTRIFNPGLPFLGGAQVHYLTPSNPPKCPTPSPKAKKAYPPKCPAPSPKAKKFDPPKPLSVKAKKTDPSRPPTPSPKAKKVDRPKPLSLKAKKPDPPKTPSPFPKAKKAGSRKKKDDNPGIQKRQFVVGSNQGNGNMGDKNRKFLDGDKKEKVHLHVGKIILQRGRDHQETKILQLGWDDVETETDGETETDWETETDDEEIETDEESDWEIETDEESDWEIETDDEEIETDEESETDGETESDGEIETKALLYLMIEKQKPKHYYING